MSTLKWTLDLGHLPKTRALMRSGTVGVMKAHRRMLLIWGATDVSDFYELEIIADRLEGGLNFDCVLAATRGFPTSDVPAKVTTFTGFVADAIDAQNGGLSDNSAHIAGARVNHDERVVTPSQWRRGRSDSGRIVGLDQPNRFIGRINTTGGYS